MEKGTLLQMKNLLHRTSVPQDPTKDVNACEDFLEVVTIAHVIAAAMQYFHMDAIDSTPSTDLLPEGMLDLSLEQQQAVLFEHIGRLVDQFVSLGTEKPASTAENKNADGVQNYATQILSLGLVHAEFVDAIREGDELRVIQLWRLLLPLFKSANRRNYANEALNLLLQYTFFLSPR